MVDVTSIVKDKVIEGLTQAAANKNNDLKTKDVEAVAKTVVPEVTKEVNSVIKNQTNQEPWYQSNVTLGLILTALATIVKPWAPDIAPVLEDPATVNAIMTAIQLVGLLWSFAGRWWISKPLGE